MLFRSRDIGEGAADVGGEPKAGTIGRRCNALIHVPVGGLHVTRRANSMSPLSGRWQRRSGVSKPGGGRQDNARSKGGGQCTWGDHRLTGSPAPGLAGASALLGTPCPRAMSLALGTNTLKFIYIFGGRNFDLVHGTIGTLPRLGRQEVVRPGLTEG